MVSWRRGRWAAGRVVAVAAVLAAGVTTPAAGDPAPPDAGGDPVARYQALSSRAERLNEDFLEAHANLSEQRSRLREANVSLGKAVRVRSGTRAQEQRAQVDVDKLADASLRGARFHQFSAVLTGRSPGDILDRAAALGVLSDNNETTLRQAARTADRAGQAESTARGVRQRIRVATDAAARLTTDLGKRRQALREQIDDVKRALSQLRAEDQAELGDPGDMGSFVAAPGAANTLLQAALAQRGKPYEWGAAGPDAYDCSGLTLWAYDKAGIALPHSSRMQYQMGDAVDYGQWQPGDLLFWGSDPASIHHVGLYVGEGKMVHASTEGVPVKVDPVSEGGSDYLGARRILGG